MAARVDHVPLTTMSASAKTRSASSASPASQSEAREVVGLIRLVVADQRRVGSSALRALTAGSGSYSTSISGSASRAE